MTFNVTVPNASQSPSLFPPQNNNNYQRLRDIINAEHNFLNTAGAAQGIHKQCTMINRAHPAAIPTGNGIFYSAIDSLTSLSELFWYNGLRMQITGQQFINISGLSSVGNGVTTPILPNPGVNYVAIAWVGVKNSATSNMQMAVRWVAGPVNSIPTPPQSIAHTASGDTRLPIGFVGNDLSVFNGTGGTVDLNWVTIYFRIP